MNRQISKTEGRETGLAGKNGMSRLLRAREAAGQADAWQNTLLELQQTYPGLEIEPALQKPALRALLRAGIPFRQAFEAANLEEIKAVIAAQAEQMMVDRMAASALRARENGITAGRTAPFGTGRTHLSREDREDIVQRVLRGEEIRL